MKKMIGKKSLTAAVVVAWSCSTFAQDGCQQWSKFAEMSASMRDSGVSEDRALKFIGSRIPDDQELAIATTLNHRIYTEPTLRAMNSARVGSALLQLCKQQ